MLPNDPERTLRTAVGSRVAWADAVLVSIPLSFLAAWGLAVATAMTAPESAVVGTGAAVAVTGYALAAAAVEN